MVKMQESTMGFEVFDKRMTPLAKAPSVTIQKRGVISLNKAAHDLIGNAETVELLYDRDRNVVALRAADDFCPHAYAVRSGSKNGPGQAIVSATAFTAHYGIDTTATRRWKPFTEDGMLCVDLTLQGTVITGNRTKSLTPAPVTETAEATETDEADQIAEDIDDSPTAVEDTPDDA
ncbi:hypothetical protein GCM10011374_24380 [Kocuria dechangensis]|uniref:Uncharacterized protein n=1 Tax=Kocuria dechangensis TaxID=1176249 RepID=A0A917GXI5_9MICC|nr:hypothetical protein [Kocuria dechangensis]GGG60630.1 hypothetical protein GCM10011374_24380 [Kocuria dechangensis]